MASPLFLADSFNLSMLDEGEERAVVERLCAQEAADMLSGGFVSVVTSKKVAELIEKEIGSPVPVDSIKRDLVINHTAPVFIVALVVGNVVSFYCVSIP